MGREEEHLSHTSGGTIKAALFPRRSNKGDSRSILRFAFEWYIVYSTLLRSTRLSPWLGEEDLFACFVKKETALRFSHAFLRSRRFLVAVC